MSSAAVVVDVVGERDGLKCGLSTSVIAVSPTSQRATEPLKTGVIARRPFLPRTPDPIQPVRRNR